MFVLTSPYFNKASLPYEVYNLRYLALLIRFFQHKLKKVTTLLLVIITYTCILVKINK